MLTSKLEVEVKAEAEVKIEVRSTERICSSSSSQNFRFLAWKMAELCLVEIFDL